MSLESWEHLWRDLAPQVLGALVRRYGHFSLAEDAVQEALLAAAEQWPAQGLPANPRGWLITVASRHLIDCLRAEGARRRREERFASLETPATVESDLIPERDDALALIFMCCHPALSPASRIALTLRAVGGLTTAQIARAFLVPEATMRQRISRAKQSIRASGIPFAVPPAAERNARLGEVLHVLYLIFNEGYTASSGADLYQVELSREAIRLAYILHDLLPEDGEVAGLLALMLLTDARRPARTQPDGSLIPLVEQNRSLWDRAAITRGVALLTDALQRAPIGSYQVQAAVAAVHAEAASADATDWAQILALYRLLETLAPNPMVTLNRAVALAMVEGPAAGLALLDELAAVGDLAGHHRFFAVRGHLLEQAGDLAAARVTYEHAARLTTSLPERRYLESRSRGVEKPRSRGGDVQCHDHPGTSAP